MAAYEAALTHNPVLMDMTHVIFMVAYSLAFLLGMVGNGWIIFITGFQVKKTVTPMWFLNMAIADFMFTAFIPFRVTYIALGVRWPLGNMMYKLTIIVTALNMFTRVFLLTVINADHCISMACPVWSRNHRSPRLASLVILVVWILSLALSLRYHDLCVQDDLLLRKRRMMASVALHFLVGFLVPLALIITCYILLAAKPRRSHLTQSRKPLNVHLVLILIFYLCWLPYHVFYFLQVSGDALNPVMKKSLDIGILFAYGLLCFNSCVTPVVFLSMGQEFMGCRGNARNYQNAVHLEGEPAEEGRNVQGEMGSIHKLYAS
ncbi:chemerin chemokine-like receptor 1 [Chelydra serpentina]|uniref:Chemerin chemokine-like receptor 1 n=1 Tax=Chelydra serpentina TaxID=8475 RepID=A0A8T1RXX3_CHESE|nr:chemerin chemokine-like receptor 1 [Chelydra serpentina]